MLIIISAFVITNNAYTTVNITQDWIDKVATLPNPYENYKNPKSITYHVHYVSEGGSGSMSDDNKEAKIYDDKNVTDDLYTLKECNFSAPIFCDFDSWKIKDDIFSPGAQINLSKYTNTNNYIDVHVIWKPNFVQIGVAIGIALTIIVLTICYCVIKKQNNDKQPILKENINKNTDTQINSKDPEILIKYKKLLDEEVITQEEFDAKKKDILNL